MEIPCINCGNENLDSKAIQIAGEVRGETYSVEMRGLECPSCGYKTIEGVDIAEFKRLLADKYREKHGLLTSKQIRARRDTMHMSQLEFADFLDVGRASLKRWEMGRIQDKKSNDLIVKKTTFAYDRTTASSFLAAASTALDFRCHYAIKSTDFIVTTRAPHCANVLRQYLRSFLEKAKNELGQYGFGTKGTVLSTTTLSEADTDYALTHLLSNQKESRARRE